MNTKLKIPNYEIIREIAEGGMATVYLARQKNLDREVALKVMSPTFASDKVLRDNFLQEGQIIARLSHPHIITIHDIGIAENHYYMAMEYMPGDTLKERIQKGLTQHQCIDIIKQLAKALGYAHYHEFVHRDIKPGNVLFRNVDIAILTDFGVAKAKKTTGDLTRMGYMVGTPHYMSPEQATGKGIDQRSDLYSLGVLFYEMLTQSRPYTADNTMAIAYKHVNDPLPALPIELKHLQRVLDKLLAKNKEDRFENAREFISALEQTDDTATRLMPSLVKRRSPANQIDQTSVTELITSPIKPLLNFFNSILYNLRMWWSAVVKKPLKKGSDLTGFHKLNDQTSSDEIASKLELMQRQQRELEQQLTQQKKNTKELEKQLLLERENRSAVSEKTLVRMQELDEQVRVENIRAEELEVILKGSAEEISQLNQHVEIEQKAFSDDTKPEHYVLENDGTLETDDLESTLQLDSRVTMELPMGEEQKIESEDGPDLEATLEIQNPAGLIHKNARPGIQILTPATNKKVDGVIQVESNVSSCLLSGQVTTAAAISKLIINDHPASVGISGFFCVKYHLVANETNTIKLLATDVKGDVTERLIKINLTLQNETADSKAESDKPKATSKTHALIIGNTDYQQFPPITPAAYNANELAKLLQTKFNYQIHELKNVTAVEILRALNNIYMEFGDKDNLLVYFSGHGIINRSGDDGYWLGIEATRGQPSSWLPNQAINTMTSLFNAHQVMIVSDACFTEVDQVKRSIIDIIKPLISKTEVSMIPAQACKIVLASGWRQPITSSESPHASLFSGSLIDILREAQGFISSDNLHRELEKRVSRHQLNSLGIKPIYGKLANSKQSEGEFIFRRC